MIFGNGSKNDKVNWFNYTLTEAVFLEAVRKMSEAFLTML